MIADEGSFAAAARRTGLVPSALTYRVRQVEEALDVLLFDRRSRQARLTEAGKELVREGAALVRSIAMASRVRRIATGWEPGFTIAVDTIIDRGSFLDLCQAFPGLNSPTRLKFRDESLSGTLDPLLSGEVDLAIGLVGDLSHLSGYTMQMLGRPRFVFAVASTHALARHPEPLSDAVIEQHRIVSVADSVNRGPGMSVGFFSGQDVFTVPDMDSKLEAQLRGLGGGFLPQRLAHPYISAGRLVVKQTERSEPEIPISYGCRTVREESRGNALRWWLDHLANPTVRRAVLDAPAGRRRHSPHD